MTPEISAVTANDSSSAHSSAASAGPAAVFLPLYRSPPLYSIGAACTCLVLAICLAAPLIADITGVIPADAGAGRFFSLLKSLGRGLTALPLFDTRAFYPYSGTLALGDNFLAPLLAAAPLIALGLDPTAVGNALLILALAISGWCTYRLCYQLTGSAPAAFVGGAAFMTFPHDGAFFGGSPPFLFLLPLALSAALGFAAVPGFLSALRLGGLMTVAALCSLDTAAAAAAAALSTLGAIAAIHPSRFSFRDIGLLILGLLCGTAPALFLLIGPYRDAAELLLPSTADVILRNSTSGRFLVSAPLPLDIVTLTGAVFALKRLTDAKLLRPAALILAALVIGSGAIADPAAAAAPVRTGAALAGWGAIIAAAIILIRLGAIERRLNITFVSNRDIVAIALAVGVVAFTASLGPIDRIDGRTSGFSVYDALSALSGGFTAVEAPRIFLAAAALALAIAAAFALTRLLGRLPRLSGAVLALALVIVVERHQKVETLAARPAPSNVFDRLAQLAAPHDVVIGLPIFSDHAGAPSAAVWAEAARSNLDFIAHLRPEQTTVNGYADRPVPALAELAEAARDFPSGGSVKALSRIAGLRYIVYTQTARPASSGYTPHDDIMGRAGKEAAAVRYIESDGAGRYLFEFIAETRVRDDFFLLIPPRPDGVLSVELQALYATNEPAVPVRLFLMNGTEWRQASEGMLKADGEWRTYSFPLPSAARGPFPARIRFEVPENFRVFLRRSHFIPGEQ